MKGKKLLFTIIIAEILIIVIVGVKIYKRRNKVLGEISVNPIKMENIILEKEGELNYFYEPQPSQVLTNEGPAPFESTQTINSDSLNERFDYTQEKAKGVFRIITLGDSFTYGVYVNTKDNWPEQLEDALNENLACKNINKFEVINLGVGGYDLRYSVERFKKRGGKYKPDLVIWFLSDLGRVSDKIEPLNTKYNQQLKESGELEKQIKEGKYYEPWIRAWQEVYDQLGPEGILNYQIEALNMIINYYNGKLLLFALPNSENEREAIKNFKMERGETWYFDELTDIYKVKEAFFGPNDTHPTKLGYEMIAKDIFEYLRQENLILCD